jgi:uncharacterized membrane protein (UPF0127 family)
MSVPRRLTGLAAALAALALSFAVAPACAQANLAAFAQPILPKETVRIVTAGGATHTFELEIADEQEETRAGLMGRTSVAPDGGMLFDFGGAQPRYMWMKNTPTSLDMLFMDPSGQIVMIAENTRPLSERSVGTDVPVRVVIELAAGRTRELGIAPGDTVQFRLFGN